MAKTVAEYLSTERTATQMEFFEWVLAETGLTFKNAASRDAFDLGVRCGGLYSRFQAAKRETPVPKAAPSKRAPKATSAATEA